MTRGEDNPQALLSDDEVELLRALRDSEAHLPRARRYWTAPRLAEKFEISTRQVWNILSYKQRVTSADDVPEPKGRVSRRSYAPRKRAATTHFRSKNTHGQRKSAIVRHAAANLRFDALVKASEEGLTLAEAAERVGLLPGSVRYLVRRHLGTGRWPIRD